MHDQQLGEWPVIGRGDELALVRRELVDRQRSVVLAGPPGVGKTRLAREVLTSIAAGGGPVRSVTATRSAATTPLGSLLGLLDDGPDADPADGEPRSVFRHLRQELQAGAAPPVVAVDDAHLLDDGSAAVLHRLAEQGLVRLLLTLRVGEAAPDAVTAVWRDDLGERIELQPLSRPDVRALLRATLPGADDEGTAHRLWTVTGGNPLYLRELVREALRVGDLRQVGPSWAWDARRAVVGTRLRELVAGSLVDLEPAARAVLDLLALGEPLDVEVLDAAGVSACERRGLVAVDRHVAEHAVLRLHHPLLGDVLRAALPAADRRHLARRLAELPGIADSDPLRAAVWALDAGLDVDPARLVAAAAVALRRFDLPLAERLAGAAVAAGAGPVASLTLGRVLLAQGRYADAEAVLAPVEASAADDGDLLVCARLLADIRFWGLGRPDDAEAGLVAVGERVGEAYRHHVLALRASVRHDAGDIAGALELTGWALDPDIDPTARLQAVTSAASALTLSGRPVDALALCDELLPVALARADEVPRDVGRVLAQRIHALVALCRLDEAEGIIAFVHGVAAAEGDDEVQGGAALVLAQLALERGRVTDGAAWAREAITVLRRFDPQRNLPWALGLAARAAALAGDGTAATAAASEARKLADASPVDVADVAVAVGVALAAAATGERTRAGEEALAAADRAEAAGDRFTAAVALDAALGVGVAAAQVAARLDALVGDGQVPWIVAWRDHARALADGDGAALEAVGERFAALGAELRAAVAFRDAGGAHERAGLRSSAARARGRSARHLAACPGAVVPAAGGALSTLTRREREVVTLAAEGLTNAAIAERLTVGVRTVEGHLLRATTKLGVRGRAELAEVLGGRTA